MWNIYGLNTTSNNNFFRNAAPLLDLWDSNKRTLGVLCGFSKPNGKFLPNADPILFGSAFSFLFPYSISEAKINGYTTVENATEGTIDRYWWEEEGVELYFNAQNIASVSIDLSLKVNAAFVDRLSTIQLSLENFTLDHIYSSDNIRLEEGTNYSVTGNQISVIYPYASNDLIELQLIGTFTIPDLSVYEYAKILLFDISSLGVDDSTIIEEFSWLNKTYIPQTEQYSPSVGQFYQVKNNLLIVYCDVDTENTVSLEESDRLILSQEIGVDTYVDYESI